MISTHWSQVHQPSDHDLRLLDVLARQAADLIERTEAEQVAQRLSAIVDSSYDAIVSKDLNGIITSWNNGAERLFGYRAEEVIGKPIMILIPADHPNEEPNILDRIRRGERVEPYETVRRRKDGSPVEILLTVSPIKNAYGRVVGASKIAHDISERKRSEELLRTVMHELSHRSKNLLSVIQAMAQQTARLSPSVDAFLDRFIGRVQGLAASQDLLVHQNWTGVSLDELVRQQLQAFGGRDAGRIEADGPPLYVAPDAAQTLGLALHELATNASKYGALSVPGGSVTVQWNIEPGSGAPRFRMSWRERGGPSVETPDAQRIWAHAHRAADGGKARRDRSAHVRSRGRGLDARRGRARCAGGHEPTSPALSRRPLRPTPLRGHLLRASVHVTAMDRRVEHGLDGAGAPTGDARLSRTKRGATAHERDDDGEELC